MDSELQVRSLLQQLSLDVDSGTQQSIGRSIVTLISSPDYRDGALSSILRGGLTDSLATGLPAG